MLPFKTNYSYKLKILFILWQAKKTSEKAIKNGEAYITI
jgi:hypothetical protein